MSFGRLHDLRETLALIACDGAERAGPEAHNPYEGQNGIPIRDIIELEKPLTSAADQPAASPSVRQAPVSGS